MSFKEKIKAPIRKVLKKTPFGDNKTLVVDVGVLFLVLIGALVVQVVVSIVAVGGNRSTLIWNSWYPYEGRWARYSVSGPITEDIGANEILVTVASVDESAGTSTLSIKLYNDGVGAGENTVIVKSQEGTIVGGPNAGKFLIFYVEASDIGVGLFDEKNVSIAVTYTGLNDTIIYTFRYIGIEMHYHTVAFGPQFSKILEARDNESVSYSHQWNDASTGTLIEAEYYTAEGRNTILLIDGSFELTGPNRIIALFVFGIAMNLWAVFHVWRLKKHPEDQYFEMDPNGITRFMIRANAFVMFDYMGIMWGTVEFNIAYNLIGLALLVYATGPFGLIMLVRFTGLVPGVQWPFGVLAAIIAVICYDVYCLQKTKIQKLEAKLQLNLKK